MTVTPLECYLGFVTAYEQARRTDDWATLSRLVSEQSLFVLPLDNHGGGDYEGRDAFLFHSKAREHLFSRRFDHCELGSLGVPRVSDDTVAHLVFAVWRRSGLPDLTVEFDLQVTFDEGLAVRIEEVWAPQMQARMKSYVADHGVTLGAAADSLDLAPSSDLTQLRRRMQLIERRVKSRNGLAGAIDRAGLSETVLVECGSTWRGCDMPDITLEYELIYTFGGSGDVPVRTRWQPSMRGQWAAQFAELRSSAPTPGGGRPRA